MRDIKGTHVPKYFFIDFKSFLLNSTLLPLYIWCCPMHVSKFKLEKTEVPSQKNAMCVAALALQHILWNSNPVKSLLYLLDKNHKTFPMPAGPQSSKQKEGTPLELEETQGKLVQHTASCILEVKENNATMLPLLIKAEISLKQKESINFYATLKQITASKSLPKECQNRLIHFL